MQHGNLGSLDSIYFIVWSCIYIAATWQLWKRAFSQKSSFRTFCIIAGSILICMLIVGLFTDIYMHSELGVTLSNAAGILSSIVFFLKYYKATR